MRASVVYVVEYIDDYGNKQIEAVLNSREEFPLWLEFHNSDREDPEQDFNFKITKTVRYETQN